MGGAGHALDVVSVPNSTPLKCAFRTNETRRCGVRALHAGVQVGAVQIIQADLQTYSNSIARRCSGGRLGTMPMRLA